MREWELWQSHSWFTNDPAIDRLQQVTRAAQINLPSERAQRAIVALTDCTAPRWVPGFTMPEHYPTRGFMVDLEVQADTEGMEPPLLHKERWFKTLREAEGCAALFMWALEGCSDAELIALALEHNGRMT